jgi:hypothetical protein
MMYVSGSWNACKLVNEMLEVDSHAYSTKLFTSSALHKRAMQG